MKQRLQDAFAAILIIIARLATPAIERRLARVATFLISDIPLLDSAWIVRFYESTKGETRRVDIDSVLHQFGRRVHGTGHIQGEPHEIFEYFGTIKRNVLYGTFRRKDAHILAGTGSFVLKIDAYSKTMKGYCVWYDNQVDGPWISKYSWRRKG